MYYYLEKLCSEICIKSRTPQITYWSYIWLDRKDYRLQLRVRGLNKHRLPDHKIFAQRAEMENRIRKH